MANNTPYEQLTGVWKFYLAAPSTAEPAVNTTPGVAWTLLGATDGDQSIEFGGALTFFRDNDHQGPVKAVRSEEDVMVSFTLVGLTLENYARILSNVANVETDVGPPAVKRLPHRRGIHPTNYALLAKGNLDSPYGAYPGQRYIPIVVSDSNPTETRAKDGRAALECQFTALEDDTQSDGDQLGWMTAQTS